MAPLLGMVPADYSDVLLLDLKAILQDPDLKAAFEREGALAVLGPLSGPIQKQVELVAVAQGERGLLTVAQGPLDIPGLIASVKAAGAQVTTEAYGPFQISIARLTLPFVTLNVAVGVFNETTAMLSLSSGAGPASVDAVKQALDTAQGSKPAFPSDPALLNAVPPGISMAFGNDCAHLISVLQGCTGFALSTTRAGDKGTIQAALAFSTPEQVKAAGPVVQELLKQGLEGVPSLGADARIVALSENVMVLQSSIDLSQAILKALGG
jgi:hypothetical protein